MDAARRSAGFTPRSSRGVRLFASPIEQFHIRGLARTHSRAGVLIFVSLAERYAQIIADEGLSGKITEAEWRETGRGRMIADLRDGRIDRGFCRGDQASGVLLARAAPPDGAGNDFPTGWSASN